MSNISDFRSYCQRFIFITLFVSLLFALFIIYFFAAGKQTPQQNPYCVIHIMHLQHLQVSYDISVISPKAKYMNI